MRPVAFALLPLVVAVSSSLGACTSFVYEAPQRTAALRDEYPPGKATRADVQSRIGHAPEASRERPAAGWTDARVLDVERRTGQKVARAEEYALPDATSFYPTISHAWYYWDAAGVLVDVVWDRMSD